MQNKRESIYLDHNATTPLDPEALSAMMPYLHEEFGNPSSSYELGVRAREALARAREEVALLIGSKARELVFTSGGTESNNAVLKGVIDFKAPERFHIITSAVEHPAILNPAMYLKDLGVDLTVLPVDGQGLVDPEAVRKAILPNTALISIMLANNETGTIQPIKEISELAGQFEVPVHTDAAQAVGKHPVDVNDLGVDFLTIAGHKVYGPKGIGALFIRSERELVPLLHGAAQEGGRRAGTENIVLSTGLGAACRVARNRLESEFQRVKGLRDRLESLLFAEVPGLVLNGHPEKRLVNTLNVSVPGMEGARILDALPRIMASTGAACHEHTVTLSHVLSAMGVPPETGMGALRFTLGRSNTEEQIEAAARLIIDEINRRRHHGNSRP